MTLGVVIGKFLPPHLGHSYLIQRACAEADRALVIVCARADDQIPAQVRAGMLRELHPQVNVVVTPDDIPDGAGEATTRAWAERTVALCAKEFGQRPGLVFTSEAYGEPYARFMGAVHVSVDPRRLAFPISGTAVRADPWANRQFLAPCVRAWYVKRVCVLGAESTGTTTLARALATHYDCIWVPEYGREYCETRVARGESIAWTTEDFVHIARRQQAAEEMAARQSERLLVCDTDALATSVWHERYLGFRSPEVERLAASQSYALYILTGDDIPFVQDGTRDGEHMRGWMTQRFREVLAERPEPWVEVRGGRAQRLQDAIGHIDAVLASPIGAR